LRITLFIGSLYGGGAERVVCNLANYLSTKGHTVEIITMVESSQNYGILPSVRTTALLNNNDRENVLIDFIHRWHNLKKYLSEEKVGCYIVFLPVTTIMLLLLRNKTNAAVVVAERADPSTYSKKTQLALKILSNRANVHVFQTKEIRNWYKGFISDEDAVIIPNAINPEFIRPLYDGEREKTIVSVGRLTEEKNFSLLIEAFAKVHKTHKEYKLVIYGEGPLRPLLEKQITELCISNFVSLPGNEKDIISKIEGACMFVLSSRHEGMPNALMEAMALGLPCVSTDCGGGGARYLINNGENGLLVANGDKLALIEAMKRLLSDVEYSNRLANNARKITDYLSPNIIYSKWESIIGEAIRKTR